MADSGASSYTQNSAGRDRDHPRWSVRVFLDFAAPPLKARLAADLGRPSRILHHTVIDLAVAQGDDVERVVLIEPPRPLRALLGHFCDRALHVARRKIQRRQFRNRWIEIVRHALLVAVP